MESFCTIVSMRRPGRDDPCPCGHPKKYKHCCLPLKKGKNQRDTLIQRARTLDDRTLTLLEATSDIFDLKKPWEHVKNGMSDARISEFYQVIARLWPRDLNYRQLLPEPDGTLRALYLGENDVELMLNNVFRFSLYADQIILVHPFCNPNRLKEKFNPILHPGEWRVNTLRLVYQLRILMPWIVSGLVTLIPDPADFDDALFLKTVALAKKRLEAIGGVSGLGDLEIDESNAAKRTRDMFLLAPDDYLARTAREAIPDITEEGIQGVLSYIKQQRRDHPLLPPGTLDQMGGQMNSFNMGANLEMGLFLCQAMGAFPYTNVKFRWKEILSAGEQLGPDAQLRSPLTNAFGRLKFKFLDKVDPNFAVEMRKEGRLESFRSYTRKLWQIVGGDVDSSKVDSIARDFSDELTAEYAKAQAEWAAIDSDLLKWGIPGLAGLVAGLGGLATGLYQVALPGGGLALNGVNELIQAHLKRKAFRKKTPLSVFIDLEAK